MINGNDQDPGQDPDAGGPGPAPDTGALRVIPDGGLAPGAGGGRRAPGGGGLIPGIAADAPGPEIGGRKKRIENVQKLHRKATAAPEGPAVPAANGTGEVAACLDPQRSLDLPRENCPAPRLLADTRKRKRRIKTARETVTETEKTIGNEIGKKGNVPPARRAKTRTRTETESPTARREM